MAREQPFAEVEKEAAKGFAEPDAHGQADGDGGDGVKFGGKGDYG